MYCVHSAHKAAPGPHLAPVTSAFNAGNTNATASANARQNLDVWLGGGGVRLRLGGREKANARALERGVVLLESNESQFTLRGEGVHLRR